MIDAKEGISKYKLEVQIPGLPATYNAIGMKSRWMRKRNTDEWKSNVCAAVSGKLPPAPLTRAKCTLTRHSSSRPDFEAIVLSMKPALDGLVEAGVLADDSLEVIGESKYSWKKTERGKGFIELSIEEI